MNDTKALHKVECPCCHGDGELSVYQIDSVTGVTEPMGKQFCTHCSGMGWVMAEIKAEWTKAPCVHGKTVGTCEICQSQPMM